MIYTRVIPQTIELTETYCYEQYISSYEPPNPKGEPQGKIEVIIPYDGKNYFHPIGIQDVINQTRKEMLQSEIKANIGTLAISNHDKTNLEKLLFNNQSLQLYIPVANQQLTDINLLYKNKYTCILTHQYQAKFPNFQIIRHEINVLDDDDFLSISSSEENKILWNEIKHLDDENFANEISKIFPEQFKLELENSHDIGRKSLFIQIYIRLALPIDFKLSEKPFVKRISIEWPSLTSLQDFSLKIGDSNNDELNSQFNIIYNPLNRTLEIIPLSSNNYLDLDELNNDRTSTETLYTLKILLGIPQPGKVYEQTKLKGKIEVEIPKRLLSGLQARYYGYNNNDSNNSIVGELTKQNIKFKTNLVSDFVLFLNEALQQRLHTTIKKLVFENILPVDKHIRVIQDILRSQGFVCDLKKLSNKYLNTNSPKWLIHAYTEIDGMIMILWLTVSGEVKSVLLTTSGEGNSFQREEEIGKLEIFLLGKLHCEGHALIQRMDKLEIALREELKKFQKGPDVKIRY